MEKPGLHNYEAWFLDYIENRLTVRQAEQLKAFLQKHPELEAELDAMQELPHLPVETIAYTGKEDLIRTIVPYAMIHAENYEQYLVAELENELNDETAHALEVFMQQNPFLAKERILINSLKLKPYREIFPEKTDLYREEEPVRKPVPMFYLAGAGIAALLILNLGIFYMLVPGKKSTKAALYSLMIRHPSPDIYIPTVNHHPEISVTSQNQDRQNQKQMKREAMEPVYFNVSAMTAFYVQDAENSSVQLPEESLLLAEVMPDKNQYFPKERRVSGNVIDVWSRSLAENSNDTWVLRIDRDKNGKTKKIRFSSPLFNINP